MMGTKIRQKKIRVGGATRVVVLSPAGFLPGLGAASVTLGVSMSMLQAIVVYYWTCCLCH